jgi:hypothetical protein
MRITVALLILLSTHLVIEPAPRAAAQTGTNAMADSVMPADRFWQVIDRTTKYQGDQDAQMEALRMELRKLSVAEIEAFERAFQHQQRRAYSWDLWGAAYVMNGGASDDGFEYFQRWLVSRGRKVFEAAIADPESLADLPTSDSPEDHEFEAFAAVAGEVWAEKTGINPWADPQSRYPYAVVPLPAEPAGVPFEEDETHLAKRYPKLWARFGTPPQ